MIRKYKLVATALVAVALTLAPMPSRSAGTVVDFSLRDLNGHVTRLSEYRGHPVILDFWATWCGPCRHQIPELKKIYQRYHQSKGLVVLGIACDTVQGEGAQSVRPFVKEYEINYPILLAETDVLDSFGVEAIPTTVFLGPDGSIIGRMTGAVPGELREGVNALLANPSGHAKPKKVTPEEEKRENLYNIEYRR